MKAIGIISTAALSLLLGVAAPSYAQDQQDQKQEQKDKRADKKAQEDKSAKPEQKTAPQQDKNTKQEEKSAQQQDKNTKQEEKNTQQAQRSGGGRIPADRYQANFGREHSFRVSEADYGRDRRFQYGGYSFEFVDAWPSNWPYTQDVFVVEINGVYYLCNPMYPGINITLSIVE